MLAGALCISVPLAFAQDPVLIVGGDGPEVLNGTPADDALYGRGGNDTLNGLGGNDDLDGGPGADILSGGDGIDSVSYAGPTGVSVSINGVADDGDGDNVGSDVEDIFGSDGNDKLRGSGGPNTIDGGPGDDTIDGGSGRDALYGDAGDDLVTARDGRFDLIDCGDGNDRAVVDLEDRTVGCENVQRPVVTAGFKIAGYPTRAGTRLRAIELVGVANGSRIVVGCRSGCRPSASRKRSVTTRRSARTSNGAVTLALPRRPAIVGGTSFEVGITASGADHGRCVVFRVGRRLAGLPRLPSKKCLTVAKTK